MRRLLPHCLLAALVLSLASVAHADDQAPPNDIRDKIKAQMEKILALMKQNQDALLELSANRKAEPKPVDVDVEPPAGAPAKPPEASKPPEAGPDQGARAAQEIEKLLRTASAESRRIPGEITKLLEMIPT